jgi:hypothetical protein
MDDRAHPRSLKNEEPDHLAPRAITAPRRSASVSPSRGSNSAAMEKTFHRLDVGADWNSFLAGFCRVGFSFYCGVAISNFYPLIRPKIRFPSWLIVLTLPILLSIPFEGGALAHLYELACVLLIFPVLIFFRSHRCGAKALDGRDFRRGVLRHLYNSPSAHFICSNDSQTLRDPTELVGGDCVCLRSYSPYFDGCLS